MGVNFGAEANVMKVLVTGATGFIGREIVEELIKLNLNVIKVGGKKTSDENFNKRIAENLYFADITDGKTLSEIETGGQVDAVVHAAGLAHQFKNIEREKFEAVNVLGTKNVAELAVRLKARQFILISSTAVYGSKKSVKNSRRQLSEIAIDENSEAGPETFYAESKLAAEREARAVCEKNNVDLTILRLAPVVGEKSAGNAARLIEAIDGKRFLWIGAGENFKTLIYKKDVARACGLVLLNKKGGTEIFNLAAAPVKMSELVETIAANLNRRVPNIKIPAPMAKLIFRVNQKTFGVKKISQIAETIEKWLSDDIYAAEKIADAYGFKAETSIETALKKQIEAYRETKEENKK